MENETNGLFNSSFNQDAAKEFIPVVFSTTSSAMAVVADDGTVLRINPEMEKLLGWENREIENKTHFLSFIASQEAARIQQFHLRRGRNDPSLPEHYTTSIRNRQGREIPVQLRVGMLGKNRWRVVSMIDISRNRDNIAALKASEKWYCTLFNSSRDAIFVALADGSIIEANPAAARLTGFGVEELDRMKLMDLVHPDQRNRIAVLCRRVAEGESVLSEARFLRKDADPIEVEFSGQKVAIEEDAFITIAARDLSDSKRLEQLLLRAQRMEAIGNLAGGIAHDFNNVLGAIMGNAEMIIRDIPEGRSPEHSARQILKASHRAKDLTRQILSFSRQDNKEMQPVKAGKVLREVAKLLRASMPTTISLTAEIATDKDTIFGDPTQIHQLLMNLCTNAVHAMRVSGGHLGLRIGHCLVDQQTAAKVPHLQPGSHVTIEVTDTGHGIAPELIEKIFDPFFSTKPEGEGTGLGLALAQGIVWRHEGAISVSSRIGQGTTFCAFLPYLESTLPGPADSANDEIARGSETLLLVDDEEDLLEIHKRMLQYLGYRVETANGSAKALEMFGTDPGRWNLVITDMTMPQMTGVHLAEHLRALRPDLPIILCTGYSDLISSDKARQKGLDALVMKPIKLQSIARVIRQALDARKQSGG